ncbi:MAG: tetratricopeptide repeat protein [Bacteroidales bacterium]|nr:tetratricopeptide repeat protein [Bacteroidales bacterium]
MAQENPQVSELLSQANNHINAKAYDQALDKLQQVLQIQINNVEAEKKRIEVYILMDNLKEASNLIDENIIKNPREFYFFYLRGLVNLNKGKYDKAISDFDLALNATSPKERSTIYLRRGIANTYIQEYDLAIKDMTLALENDNSNLNAYNSRGMAYYELKDYVQAVDDFKKVLEYTSDNAITYYNLAMSYFRMEDKKNACKNFSKACSMGYKNACRMIMMECVDEINLPK